MVVAFKMSKKVIPGFYIEMVFNNFLRNKFNPGKNKNFLKKLIHYNRSAGKESYVDLECSGLKGEVSC
jgi:hypothetical protein